MNTRLTVFFSVLALWVPLRPAAPADCNRNGVEDALDLSTPLVDFVPGRTLSFPSPRWLLPQDVDGDRDPDLLAYDSRGAQLILFDNVGSGELVERGTLPEVLEANPMGGADLDLDGGLDLLLGEQFAVRIRWNDGGAFDRETRLPLLQNLRHASTSDVDGDGDLDLICIGGPSHRSPDSISVIENQGGGAFAAPGSFGGGVRYSAVEPGDLDGDGDQDLVALIADSQRMTVFENHGGLSFGQALGDIELPGFFPKAIVLVDLDGDGQDEVLATGYPFRLLILSKKWHPLPVVTGAIDLGSGGSSRVLPLDVDGDRDVDLIAPGLGCPVFRVLIGDGRGGFPAQRTLRADLRYSRLSAADWDGDGWPDLAAGSLDGLRLFIQRPSTRSLDCNRNAVPDECEGDCNRNNFPDDCDIASGASLDCNANQTPDDCDPDCDGNGVPDDCDIRSRPAADCDGNGILDSCELTARDRDGDQVLDDCVIAGSPDADCNRNGLLDLLEVRPMFSFAQEELRLSDHAGSLVLADLDGDGDLEVVTGHREAGAVSILETGADGSLSGPRTQLLGAAVWALAVLDAGDEGAPDLAAILEGPPAATGCHGWVATLLNRGNLQLARGPAYPIQPVPRVLAAGRLDRDRTVDLVVSTTTDSANRAGITWWLRGLGGGAFELPAVISSTAISSWPTWTGMGMMTWLLPGASCSSARGTGPSWSFTRTSSMGSTSPRRTWTGTGTLISSPTGLARSTSRSTRGMASSSGRSWAWPIPAGMRL